MTGGYDEGYQACPCFWGKEPGSLVKQLAGVMNTFADKLVLDVGCGEGKNAAFLADNGARVTAIDISAMALKNAGREWGNHKQITWKVGDVRELSFHDSMYDVVIAYGVLHCLQSSTQIESVLRKLQKATKSGGYVIVCCFNNRSQDLTAHPELKPCLLDHKFFVSFFLDWKILTLTDSDLTEIHPNNNIRHTHSMTRILAKKP